MQSIPGLVHTLLLQTPQFLVLTLFLVMSVARWSRHPKASALALAGAIVLLVEIAGSVTFYAWLPTTAWFQSMSGSPPFSIGGSQVDRFYDACGLVDNLITSVGMGLCFMAVFVGRHRIVAAFPIELSSMPSRAAPPPLPPR